MNIFHDLQTICVSTIVALREPCSGICLLENARTFYSLTHRGKQLVKYKVPGDQDRVSKLVPTSKERTAHRMDSNVMVRCNGEPIKLEHVRDSDEMNVSLLFQVVP